MKTSKLEILGIQTMSISEMKNQNSGCHDDEQLHHLLVALFQADSMGDQKGVSEILTKFGKRYDEVCPN